MFLEEAMKTTKWKNTKINCNTTGGVPSQIRLFPRVQTMLCILVSPFNVNVSVMGLQFWICCWSWGIPRPPRAAAPATPSEETRHESEWNECLLRNL